MCAHIDLCRSCVWLRVIITVYIIKYQFYILYKQQSSLLYTFIYARSTCSVYVQYIYINKPLHIYVLVTPSIWHIDDVKHYRIETQLPLQMNLLTTTTHARTIPSYTYIFIGCFRRTHSHTKVLIILLRRVA